LHALQACRRHELFLEIGEQDRVLVEVATRSWWQWRRRRRRRAGAPAVLRLAALWESAAA